MADDFHCPCGDPMLESLRPLLKATLDAWNAWLQGKLQQVEAERGRYLELIGEARGRRQEELEFELETVEVEEFIDEKEEPIADESEL